MKSKELQNQPDSKSCLDKRVSGALESLVRRFEVVNGMITIRVRGGQLCRGVEVINNIDLGDDE